MYHFEKKNTKIFSPERPRENVWEPRENVSPGPAVALDGPGANQPGTEGESARGETAEGRTSHNS